MTRAVAVAEWWAAAAASDGGATLERQRRAVCGELSVAHCPPDNRVTLEQGYAIYCTLSWLLGTLDGWQRGCRPPLDILMRSADGSVAPGDKRSRELVELIEDIRRRAAVQRSAS